MCAKAHSVNKRQKQGMTRSNGHTLGQDRYNEDRLGRIIREMYEFTLRLRQCGLERVETGCDQSDTAGDRIVREL